MSNRVRKIHTDSQMEAALMQLFALANVTPPSDEIEASDVLSALRKIKAKLKGGGRKGLEDDDDEKGNPFASMASHLEPGRGAGKNMGTQNILIVGELGIVTYQLKMSLSKMGMKVTIVRGIDEAISEYQKRGYTGALIDIFMPTEREGMLVLMEIKRMEKEKGCPTDVVVLASPMREKSGDVNLKEMCRQRGAAFFLEKSEGWHQRVIDFFSGVYDPNG